MSLDLWLAFFAASWAISISPGAGAVAAMSAGLNHGFRRGYLTTVGLVLGIWTQLIVVGVGLGAVVATSSIAFAVIKWLGVAYLIYLGLQQWRAPARPMAVQAEGSPRASARELIARGWAVNAVNPKGTVFLLAVVPQFMTVGEPLWQQYLIIGLTLGFTDLVVMAAYTALAANVLHLLKSERSMRLLNRSFGTLFVAAGAWLATVSRTTS